MSEAKKPRAAKFYELPHDMRPTYEMRPEELVAEARAMDPMPAKSGRYYSATLRPRQCMIRYLRVAHFRGWLGIRPYLQFAAVLAPGVAYVALVVCFLAEFGYNADLADINMDRCMEQGWQASACDLERGRVGPLFYIPLALLVGLVLAFPVALVSMSSHLFDSTHRPFRIVQADYSDTCRRGRKIVALTTVPLLRMGWVTQADQVSPFLGEEVSHLETETDIGCVDDVRAFYDAAPRQPSWRGIYADVTHCWYNLAGNAGRLQGKLDKRPAEAPSRWQRLKACLEPGYGGFLLFLAAIPFFLIMMLTGFDLFAYCADRLTN